MKLRVTCRHGAGLDGMAWIPAVRHEFKDWIGPVPRVGEYVVIHDGWCSEEVLAVHHNLYDRSVDVEIRADSTGEYAAAAAPSRREEPRC
jgi:hypothetical protein